MDTALETSPNDVRAISLAPLALPTVEHGFLGRFGGVSRGVFGSFNLAQSVGDDPAAVAENWRIWREAYPGMVPALVRQIHGGQVRSIDRGYNGSREPGDGMVTAATGLALCIFTADCVPVLLADADHHVVGALHAGWRGTLANIASEGVRAMVTLGARPDSIHAALGPAVGLCCFEIDEELAERFARTIPGSERHTRPGVRGKAYLDLRAIVAWQLANAGVDVTRILVAGPCTKCANGRYFSRRGAAGSTTGLQMSFIGLAR